MSGIHSVGAKRYAGSMTPPTALRRFSSRLLRQMQVALAVVPFLALSPLQADEDAWEAIAEDAAVVVRVGNPRQLIEQTTAFCELVQKGSGGQVRALVSSVGEKFSTPEFAGVDRDLNWWVAMYAAKDDRPPNIALILPTTDEKAIQAALRKNVRAVKHGKYVAYSIDAVADRTPGKLHEEGKGVPALLDRESRMLFDSGQLSVLINVPVLIRAHQAQAEKERASERGRGNFSRAWRVESSGSLLESLVHAAPDMRSVTVAGTVGDDGVALDCRVRLRPGTPTAELLPKSAPDRLEDIGALPPGGVIYAGAVADWALLLRKLARESHDNRVLRPPAEQVAAEAELRELHFESICDSIARFEFEGVVDEATIRRTAEGESFRRLSQQLARAKNGGDTASFRWAVETKPGAERYGDDVANISKWRRVFRNRADAQFLPQSWVTRTVYRPDVVVESSGADQTVIQHILKALAPEQKVRQVNASFQRTRRKLDAQADAVLLIDAPKACVKIVDAVLRGLMQAFSDQFLFGLPIGASQDADAGSESYCGVSFAGRPGGVRPRAFIPLEQFQRFAQLLEAAKARGAMQSNTQDPELNRAAPR